MIVLRLLPTGLLTTIKFTTMPHCRVRLFPKLTILMLVLSNQHTVHVKKYNLFNYGKKMMQTLGPLMWNDLPPLIQDESSIDTFKIHLKTFLIGKYNQ